MRRLTSHVAVAGLAFVAGFGASSLRASPTATPAPVASIVPASDAPVASAAAPQPPSLVPDCGSLAGDLAACQMELHAWVGTPTEFPEGIAPEYRDEAVLRGALDLARSACPELAIEDDYVDCDEYPCLLFTQSPRQGSQKLIDCPSWHVETDVKGAMWSQDGTRQVTWFAIHPNEGTESATSDQRLQTRASIGQDYFLEKWGLR
jgi:hypothetical protein